MKKFFSLITAFTLLFCLASCNSSNTPANDITSSSEEVQSSGDNRQSEPDDSRQNPPALSEKNSDPADEPTETGSTAIVVYFSHSGNTESVAKEIQSQTGADIFEIVPATPYTTDYNTLLDVAQNEKRDNARPEISGTVENLGNYDTVFLGYPNWWASIPMPIATFLEEYDFSGKTIIPFCSHGGGRFGQSLTAITKLAPDAAMGEALSVHYSGGNSLPDDIEKWLESNGLNGSDAQ